MIIANILRIDKLSCETASIARNFDEGAAVLFGFTTKQLLSFAIEVELYTKAIHSTPSK